MEYTDIELKNEKWKDIFGYDGMYQVSDLGRVRSKKYGRWKVLKNGTTGSGYLTVCLFKDNKVNGLLVHRLVASAFIPNDNIFNTEINHLNEDKTDNRAINLEWCNRKYNVTYNDIHHRKKKHKKHNCPKQFNCKRRKLAKLYRPDLTYQQNIDLFKGQGINCSCLTIWNIRKDLGLIN